MEDRWGVGGCRKEGRKADMKSCCGRQTGSLATLAATAERKRDREREREREAKLIEEGNKAQTAVREATQGADGSGDIDRDGRSAVRRTEAFVVFEPV